MFRCFLTNVCWCDSGTDHATKCGLWGGMGKGVGLVVVPRAGEQVRWGTVSWYA